VVDGEFAGSTRLGVGGWGDLIPGVKTTSGMRREASHWAIQIEPFQGS